MSEQKGFILYLDNMPYFTEATKEEAGRLICGIFEYKSSGIPPDFSDDPFLRAAFIGIKATLDRDAKKHQEKCDKNRDNIRKRWDKQRQKEHDTIEYDRIRPNTNYTDRDIGIDNDNARARVTDNDISGIPSLDEVKIYAKTIRCNNPEEFYNFNSARGWSIKGNPVKDWKALMRLWCSKGEKKKTKPTKFSNYESERVADWDSIEAQKVQESLLQEIDPEIMAELQKMKEGT